MVTAAVFSGATDEERANAARRIPDALKADRTHFGASEGVLTTPLPNSAAP